LIERLGTGSSRAAITFAGQGSDVLAGLVALVDRRPELLSRVASAAGVLSGLVASPVGVASGRFRYGIDLEEWIVDPEGAPATAYLRSAAVSYPLVLLAQILAWDELLAEGFPVAPTVAVAGHSQGLLAALAVAEAPLGPVSDERLAAYLEIAFRLGLDASACASVGPMAAVSGVRFARLSPLVSSVNEVVASPVAIGLVNAPDRLVVSGPPASLAVLRARLDELAVADDRARAEGRPSGDPLRHRWETLPIDVPFHWPGLVPAYERHRDWLASSDLLPEAQSLALPVLSPADGSDLRSVGGASDDLAEAVARSQLIEPVRWDKVVGELIGRGADWVLDLGPGVEVGRLTGRNLRGTGARVLPLASPEAMRLLVTVGAAPVSPELRWADLAPGVVELPDGRRHLDNRYSRATGQPPVILPGMTPTTADAPIVVAAANAGYSAELAGGGQPAEWIFHERLVELGELLDPGVGVVLNTLFLDPYLWNMQVGDPPGTGLLFSAKAAGAPLVGLTVSAGIPEAADAVALLDRLRDAGLVHNAFKPGTVDQIRQVLAVADAAPQHTVIVHIEGGRAGGHHSYDDLDDLLLATYADLRVRPNVIVAVGGGVGTPSRAADLLTGRWSSTYGEPLMPVDAVLIGTAAMACAEATASPQVKDLLVTTPGSPDWVPRGGATGGVRSGRSSLNADIHVADTTAARVAALLDSVAGDAAAVEARRDEIAEALAETAKPWFGDLAELTYAELLARFTELCTTTRPTRYHDPPWLDPTYRTRALTLVDRTVARLISTSGASGASAGEPAPTESSGSSADGRRAGESDGDSLVFDPSDLDDPAGALARLRRVLPAVGTTLVHPADALFFVEVCGGPGKPVPFVPVLDGEVRRWFMADALWQAQDDRYPADAVLAIPGPASVAGVTRADEPVAELLARFEQATIDALLAGGEQVRSAPRLVEEGLAPAPFGTLACGRRGPLADLCVAVTVIAADGSLRPNPLWTLVRATDEVVPTVDEDDVLERFAAAVPDSDDHLVAEVTGVEEVTVTASLAGHELVLRFDGGRDVSPPSNAWPSAVWQYDAAAYRAVTGGRYHGVPLDAASSWAWPALVELLSDPPQGKGLDVGLDGVADQLAHVVHHRHRVRPGPAWPPAEGQATAEAAARVVEVDNRGGQRQIEVVVELSSDAGLVATVEAGLLVRRPPPPGTPSRYRSTHHRRTIDVGGQAERSLLLDHEAVSGDGLTLHRRLDVDVVTTSTWPPGKGSPRFTASGRMGDLEVELDRAGDEAVNPVDALLDVLDPSIDGRRERPRVELASVDDTAPADMVAFAEIGGDHNPLHRSVLAARRAGLDEPIVHGMWTAARAAAVVVDEVCDGDAGRLVDWSVRFTAPMPLAAQMEITAARVAVDDGRWRVEVVVRGDEVVVATGVALVEPPPMALVFPGQGVQAQGMGADDRSRSRAARQVWERADAHVRTSQGWSLLDVVDRNPAELRLVGAGSGEVVRHPAGVLHRTELAQVALVVQAAAQLAELRASGALPQRFIAAGHSVGEISALVALGVLPLEAALDLVHQRGLAMQAVVLRKDDGSSPYRLAAVDPSAAGLDAARLSELVSVVADETGELAEIVNHNAEGRQYVVAGTVESLSALAGRLGSGVRVLDGIDVPFHSSVLAPAVDRYRTHLDRLIGEVDGPLLMGRWVPDLTGRPFALGPDDDARTQVIDLLARQIAAPVRWIEVQQALATPAVAGGPGVRRQVEVGPGRSPILTNLAELTGAGPAETLHAARDHDKVRWAEAPPPPVDEDDGELVVAAPAARPASVPAAAATPVADRSLGAGDALRLVLAIQARVRLDQLDEDEMLDELFQGVSSRRNQVLVDLGRELELAGTEGVLDLPLRRLADEVATRSPRYRFPGTYLRDTISAGLNRALGPAGLSRRDALGHLSTTWGLGPGLAEQVLVTVAMETRPAASARGGPLGRRGDDLPTTPAAGRQLLDQAVGWMSAATGLDLRPASTASEGAVDEATVRKAGERLESALVGAARHVLDALDPQDAAPAERADGDADRLAVLDRELGSDRAEQVAGRFDARRNVHFASIGAMARADLVALFHDAVARRRPDAELAAEADRIAIHAGDPAFAANVAWFRRQSLAADRPDVAALLDTLASARRTPLLPLAVRPTVELSDTGEPIAVETPVAASRITDLVGDIPDATPDFSGEVALVTGASPGSIAGEIVRHLLRGGATVIATTSAATLERRRWWREVYREAAAPHAELHLVPANLASFADIDALVDWLGLDDGLVPTLLVPFAAVSTVGEATEAGADGEAALRVQLLGVERLVARTAERAGRPVTVLVPLSPNHGDLGGDGPYSETKAGLEVLVRRARSEQATWGRHACIVNARIGWVRGTGLMRANDPIAGLVEERLGIRTFSAAEMGWLLAAACADPHPEGEVDVTGGLAEVTDLRAALEPLAAELADRSVMQRRHHELTTALARRLHPDEPAAGIRPLPMPQPVVPASLDPLPQPEIDARDMVVIVGAGELGPCGTAAARFALELHDGDEPLPDAVVVELVWLCGLATFERDGYRGRWIDAATGTAVDEWSLADRYRDAVAERVGLRPLAADGLLDPAGTTVLAHVHLDHDVTFEVASEDAARSFLAADPVHTSIASGTGGDGGDVWSVTRKAGTVVRVPRLVEHTRRVAGQLPTGLDLGRFGIPGDMLVSADRLALVNLACTAEAFRQAGTTPEELLAAVHPAMVANTQGAGMGGLASVRHLLRDQLLDDPRQNDRLQESLGNVVAAHVVQSYVGSYGPMVHPVAACATAAVSLEEAVDKIHAGKALAVAAGGYDDLTPEGMAGFADMAATASSDELDASGITPAEASRPNDVRRQGFVESQGGGAFLVVRGDVALRLGLPVQGVVVYAGSFGDGLQASIPAPGLGALASARPLADALARHGLSADDISFVSKHDTSTELNDPNEADLHHRLQDALGRTPGNPLLVVSQKSVTGHSKGGAAAWQVAGVLQTLATGSVPGNHNLESLDPALHPHTHLTHSHRPLHLAEPPRAALLTSLGFGHVSAVVALAHPDLFLAALPAATRPDYLAAAQSRRRAALQSHLASRHGSTPSLRRQVPPPTRAAEAALLLDPDPAPPS
jgi:fatty acid synthase